MNRSLLSMVHKAKMKEEGHQAGGGAKGDRVREMGTQGVSYIPGSNGQQVALGPEMSPPDPQV